LTEAVQLGISTDEFEQSFLHFLWILAKRFRRLVPWQLVELDTHKKDDTISFVV